jgi:probable DNA metabolism protein
MQQSGLFDHSDSGDQHRVTFAPNFKSFRAAARRALAEGIPPEAIWWVEDSEAIEPQPRHPLSQMNVPREFLQLAKFVACHKSPDRWSMLYQVLWRLTHGEPHLIALSGDPLISRMNAYDKSVHRDVHKMKAFVRFKKLQTKEPALSESTERFVAWFEPEHFIVPLATDFFVRRFTNMQWSLLTPVGCAHWDGSGQPIFSEGLKDAYKPLDELDELWKTYYKNIFNPARVKLNAMCAEMPQKYWKHLPEAEVIPALVLAADGRVESMLQTEAQPATLQCGERPASYQAQLASTLANNETKPLVRIAAGVMGCDNCELCQPATQAVPGEGPENARVMLVGEQPGDQEDLLGKPFVGPAGQLLDSILNDLDIDRTTLYLTNAVKHFRFRATPKCRLHERPKIGHINACRRWLLDEMAALQPEVIVCLGVTAATAVLGRKVSLQELSGKQLEMNGTTVIATLHPATVLRSADSSAARRYLANDISKAISLVA